MDKNRKRELKLQYKGMKHPMGVFIVRSNFSNKCYIEGTNNLKATINSTKAKLASGMHPYLELQRDCNNLGFENFTIEILEELKYDKDESKTDYTEDLALLKMIWEEKLAKENIEFYKRRI